MASTPTLSGRQAHMGPTISYELDGAGWATCRLSVEAREVSLRVSYLTDALHDLIKATSAIARGALESEAVLVEEPGCVRMSMSRVDSETTRVTFSRFDRWPIKGSGRDSEIILDLTTRTRTLAGAVLSAAQRVLRKEGLEGYRAKWRNSSFPAEAMQELATELTRR